MDRKIKLAAIVGAVVVLLLVAVLIYLNSLDFNQYKQTIAEQAREATGRELVIAGDLDLQVSLSPKVAAEGVSFSNASWGSRKEMVQVKRLLVQVNLLPLLFGDIQVSQLILEEPDVLLETDAKGRGNWQFDLAERPTEEKTDEGPSLPLVNNVRIEGASLTYLDGKSGEKRSIVIDTLEASADDMGSPLSLLLKGRLDDSLISLQGTVDSLDGLISGGDVALDLRLGLDDQTLQLTAEGSVEDEGPAYRFEKLQLQLQENRLNGKFELDLSKQPIALSADLASELIDLRGMAGEEAAETEEAQQTEDQADSPKKASKLFSDAPLPVEGMSGISARVNVNIKKILGPKYALNDLQMQLNMAKGVLKLEPFNMNIGGGRLTSKMILNASRLPASLELNVSGASLDLGKMLVETGVTDLITGAVTQVDIDLKGSGKSMASIMGSLNGKTLVNVGKGQINNKYVNLAGADLLNQLFAALNPLAKKEKFTSLECAVVNLSFKKGTAEYDKRIAIETDKMTVVSSGEINLGKETLDMGIKPKPRKDTADLGVGAGDLVSAARIHGTLANPELGLDAAGAAKAGLKVYSAIATGGTSLLVGGLLDKAMTDANPCQTALGKKSQKATEEGAPAKPTGDKPSGEQGGGGFFDGLKKKLGG